MTISQYCVHDVVTVSKNSTVLKAVDIMKCNHIDEIVVTEFSNGRVIPVGILTSHDIVMNGVISEAASQKVLVSDIMSSELVVCPEHLGVIETVQLMEQNGVKRCPVVNSAGHLVGLVVASDLFHLFSRQLNALSKFEERHVMTVENLETIYDKL